MYRHCVGILTKFNANDTDTRGEFELILIQLQLKPESSNSLNWRSFIPSSVSKNDVNHY